MSTFSSAKARIRRKSRIYEGLAATDADINVRCMALNGLIPIYFGTWDARIGSWLAGIVRDEKEAQLLRKVAYMQLFSLRMLCPPNNVPTMEIPEQIDWNFVDSFLQEKEY